MKTLLLVTVTRVETQFVFDVFEQAIGKKRESNRIGEKTYYSLGVIGDIDILMVRTEMGAATPGGSLLTLQKAIEVIKPIGIIMVGIAFGTNPEKQKMGDILVSQFIKAYEPEKEGNTPVSRGVRVNASPALLDIARAAEMDWNGPNLRFGLILSGEKLVDNLDFRNRLTKLEPEAIGGEMEGNGLYLAANDARVDWILIKAICDWADGTKNDQAQPLAAQNAAGFALSMIQHLGNSFINDPPPKPPPSEESYWNLIKDLFIRTLEKELFMNQPDYFNKPPEKYTAEGKINYLAILYFGREKHEIAMLSNQLQEIYQEANRGFISKSLKQIIKTKVVEVSRHKELTHRLVTIALEIEPHHSFGETLRNLLLAIDDQLEEVQIAIAENNNGKRLPNSVLNLQLQLHTLQECLEDSYKQLQRHLTS